MPRIRVLVVDDAVVVRRLITDALANDPDIEVIGSAANGSLCLQKIPQLNPDIITLDVEMPEMDGLTALREIRKRYPRLPVIMFSTLTERGAEVTLDALAAGAQDYVTKPSNVGSLAAALAAVREQLVPRIKTLCGRVPAPAVQVAAVVAAQTGAALATLGPRRGPTVPVGIVAIGVSTGGPNALAEVIPALPADLPVPVVVVQHMPPMFTRMLAQRLASLGHLPVQEVSGTPSLDRGVWIAPGDWHLTVAGTRLRTSAALNQGPHENSCRPAVDVLFRSVAGLYGSGVLAVVLTGMGRDGLVGAQHIKEAGGQVLAQDQATSVVWGMPGFVAQAGLADAVLPLKAIGPEIARRVRAGRS